MADPAPALTPEQLAELKDKFTAAQASGQVRVLYPVLPRRTRLRLWYQTRITRAGIWLAGHRLHRLAIMLWRATRMW